MTGAPRPAPPEPPAACAPDECAPHWTRFYAMVEELAKRLPLTPASDEQKAPHALTKRRGKGEVSNLALINE